MKKDDGGEKDEQGKLTPDELLKIGATLFGKSDPAKTDKGRKELQMLNNLEYPGGKRIH